MYLIFETTKHSVRYGLFASDGSSIHEDCQRVASWTPKIVTDIFERHLLSNLRSHGKVITKIGLIVPFADATHVKPRLAEASLLKQMSTTPVRQATLESTKLLLQLIQRTWPHLPHFFAFDTCLSESIKRTMGIPALNYDNTKLLGIKPYLLHSYAHRANIESLKPETWAISLYLGEQTSIALFCGNELKDGFWSYSPFGAVMGLEDLGQIDPGTLLDIVAKKRLNESIALLTKHAGLFEMIERRESFDELLKITGLIKDDNKSRANSPSIEVIEWMELAINSYIRAIRQAIGAMVIFHPDIDTLVVNTSIVPESSRFWSLLLQGVLDGLKINYVTKSPLYAACQDLRRIEKSS